MSKKIVCPKCQCAISHSVRPLAMDEQHSKLYAYFARSRGHLSSAARRAIQAIRASNRDTARLLALARTVLDVKGDDAVGALGEAHASYMLEQDSAIVLVHAGWKDHPFEIVKGIDLVGVDTRTWTIQYVEVKTSQSDASGIRDFTLGGLRQQLKLPRFEKQFRLKGGVGAPLSVAYALQRNAQGLKPSLRDLSIVTLLGQDTFQRVGVVVVGALNPWNPLTAACPCDSRAKRPCRLALLVVDQLPDSLRHLAALELAGLGA